LTNLLTILQLVSNFCSM